MIPLLLAAALLAAEPAAPPPEAAVPKDRALAMSAIAAAKNAVEQADSAAAKRDEASARLKEAEALFAQEKYTDAARAADGAWQLVAAHAGDPTRFAIDVKPDGKTTVTAKAGQPVRVEAEGAAQPVYPGQEVNVDKGRPPVLASTNPKAAATPAKAPAPALLTPLDGGKLKAKDGLAWQPVANAKAYEVQLFTVDGKAVKTTKTEKTRAGLAGLPAGKYRWAVRAIGPGGPGEPSAKRAFELVDPELMLNVKPTTTWK